MEHEPAADGEVADGLPAAAEAVPSLEDDSQPPFSWEPRLSSIVMFKEAAIVTLRVGGGLSWSPLRQTQRSVHVEQGLLHPNQKMLRAVVTTPGEGDEELFVSETPHWKLALPVSIKGGKFALLMLLSAETLALTARLCTKAEVAEELRAKGGAVSRDTAREQAQEVFQSQPASMYFAACFPTEGALAHASKRLVGNGLLQGVGFDAGFGAGVGDVRRESMRFAVAIGVDSKSVFDVVFDPRAAPVGSLDWGKCAVSKGSKEAKGSKEQQLPAPQISRTSRHGGQTGKTPPPCSVAVDQSNGQRRRRSRSSEATGSAVL